MNKIARSWETYVLTLILSVFLYTVWPTPKNPALEYWKSQGVSVGDTVFLRPTMESVLVTGLSVGEIEVRHKEGYSYRLETVPANLIVVDLEKK